MIHLTEESKALFIEMVKDAGNWGGTPIVGGGGNIESTPATRGNLTDLKKKGLITTFVDDRRDTVVEFTEAGKAYAAEIGLVTNEYGNKYLG